MTVANPARFGGARMSTHRAFLHCADFAAGASRLRIQQVASAFEVSTNQVLSDWAFVNSAHEMEVPDVIEHLRRRHEWDPTVAPYYVSWLQRAEG